MGVARDIRNCPGHPYIAMAHRAVTFAIAWLSCLELELLKTCKKANLVENLKTVNYSDCSKA